MWITTTITIFRLKPNQHTMRSTHSTRESRTLHSDAHDYATRFFPRQVIWNFITDPTIGPHSRIKRKFHQDKLKKKSN